MQKLNVLIPMAGLGSRFADAGYVLPKPLIDVNGKPMIQRVVESLNLDAHYIFLVQKSHLEQFNLVYVLSQLAPNISIVEVNGLTEGAASTTLLAKHLIDNDQPLVIANSDQIVEWDSKEFVSLLDNKHAILLFKDIDPKWSFVKIKNNYVIEVAEKKVISDNANVGIYGWSKGSDYVKYAEQMIDKNIRTNGEFYIAPVYNEAIEDGKKVAPFFTINMHGIGTPEDLNLYLERIKDENHIAPR